MSISTVNPTTGQTIHTYQEMSPPQLDEIIAAVHNDYLLWKNTSFSERRQLMLRAAELLVANKEQFAKLITEEMGKPINASAAEIEKCASVCSYYAEQAEALLKPQIVKTDFKKSYISYQPNGIVFAIMPWNFPFWQVFRFAAPNLMAGHGCLLKHAPISTGTGLAIETLFRQAGFPEHIFRSIIVNNDNAAYVIQHPKVSAVTLTGSARAGRAISSVAGQALKKVVLELGGSDPYVILGDADLAKAAQVCVSSRLANSGQVCIAAKRLIIVNEVYDRFKQLILNEISHYTLGDPLQLHTKLGPMARADLRDSVHQQVCKSVAQGANLLTGGELPSGAGYFYPVTILENVTPGMVAFDEEVFGPIIALVHANDEADAIQLANQTEYGLGAAVFTQDLQRGEQIATQQLQAGSCAVNTFVKSDPRLPFGGIKHSGYGRELAAQGLHEFMNIKTVTIN